MSRQMYTLAELAAKTGARIIGDGAIVIEGVEALENAGMQEISFLHNPRYEQAMRKSNAGAVVMSNAFEVVANKNFLIHDQPSQVFQTIVEMFYGDINKLSGFHNVHATAVVHPTAQLACGVTVGPYAVIDENCVIGENTFIGSGVYVGYQTSIGSDCIIHPRAVIRERCKLGNRVIVQPGAVIGSCGFGYVQNDMGAHVKLNQVGIVNIEDDVEIGANAAIDRARFKVTHIGKGTKIDNLVQIAHGVKTGQHCMIIAQTGIAGSTKLGNYVILGGQVAINGHIKLNDGVQVAAKSGVSKSLEKGVYSGIPALPIHEYNRISVLLRKIESFAKRLQVLESVNLTAIPN